MDTTSGIKIDKLRDNNFHTWKTRIQLVLSLKEVDGYIFDAPPARNSDKYADWRKGDLKAKAVIGLTLSGAHLEQVQHADSAKEMWSLICDIYEKHSLLNKLAARRRFYTAKMHENEKVLPFAARIRQLAATLKSMSVAIEDSEMAMALLNGLPDRFDSVISALDAAHTDDNLFTFEFVQSRCLKEEQRHSARDQDALKSAESAAFLAANRFKSKKNASAEICVHCGKHRDSSRCYTKFPHLAPPGHPARAGLENNANNNKAFVANNPPTSSDITEDDYVWLCNTLAARSLALHSPGISLASSQYWIIDSGCTSHVTFDRSAFISYHSFTCSSTLDLGANSNTPIVGHGDVMLKLRRHSNDNPVTCIIRNVLHVPEVRYQLLSVSAMAKLGIDTHFSDSGVSLLRRSNLSNIVSGTLTKGLYTLDIDPHTPNTTSEKPQS